MAEAESRIPLNISFSSGSDDREEEASRRSSIPSRAWIGLRREAHRSELKATDRQQEERKKSQEYRFQKHEKNKLRNETERERRNMQNHSQKKPIHVAYDLY